MCCQVGKAIGECKAIVILILNNFPLKQNPFMTYTDFPSIMELQ